ncbi:ATP-dependent DNA helicase PcrA [termite gut metagenome]|uniref:DNA 3'-5' helicase n=1 Tax=termite gut metagenome TaxID=433724 RepID=A0A5J4SYQ1_9ZZZZ
MPINYIDELNETQYEAVVYNEGPSLVIAGAGSGKTRVLTYKIAYLLENGYAPWNILALTFTNKAAREMKGRIASMVSEKRVQALFMGTFHSLFSRILRVEAAHLGFSSQFTIYDTADTKSLLRSISKEMGLDEKIYKTSIVQSRISQAKNRLILPSVYASNRDVYESDCRAKMPAVRDVYLQYWNRCRQANVMDFDDLLFYTFILFRDFPDVLSRYQEQFCYVLVDEYQDTNFAQHSIIFQLVKERQRICVVGDDAQSIYSFRGADIDNILRFSEIYPNTRLFKLEQNYRSTQTIVQAANSLIKKNQRQIYKEVFSEKDLGDPLVVFQTYSDTEEGEMTANKITELHQEEKYSYTDFAILYRTNAQSRVFEEALRRHGILYRIYGGLSFYQRKEIKDVIAYFRLVVNPNDEEAFKRIVNYPVRNIGEVTVAKILSSARNNGVSLWEILCKPLTYELPVNKSTSAKLQNFRELIESFRTDAREKNAYEMSMDIVRRSGIMNDVYSDNLPENRDRKENIEELINGIHDFCSIRQEEESTPHILLVDFLSEIALLTDQDTDTNEGERVSLMTIHAAKGLEFSNVFIVGMEEGLFPSFMVSESAQALEEERRLFYVAITRAKVHCFLSYAKIRFRYGNTEFANPSRFLHDIDVHFLQLSRNTEYYTDEISTRIRRKESVKKEQTFPNTSRKMTKVTSLTSSSFANTANTTVRIGQTVEHERFGIGEVLKIEGEDESIKVTILFKNVGNKQLLLRFAKLKVVE